jgi:hypothetical protein
MMRETHLARPRDGSACELQKLMRIEPSKTNFSTEVDANIHRS